MGNSKRGGITGIKAMYICLWFLRQTMGTAKSCRSLVVNT